MKININDPNISLEEILENTITYYSEDPTRRCVRDGNCAYNPKTVGNLNSEGCAIGRLLPDDVTLKMDEDMQNDSITNIIESEFVRLLPYKITEYPIFFQKLQDFHDDGENFDGTGITEPGKSKVQEIRNYIYSLQS